MTQNHDTSTPSTYLQHCTIAIILALLAALAWAAPSARASPAGYSPAQAAAAQAASAPDAAPAPAPQDVAPSYAALADLLANSQTRAQIIEQLRTLAAGHGQAAAHAGRSPASNHASAQASSQTPDQAAHQAPASGPAGRTASPAAGTPPQAAQTSRAGRADGSGAGTTAQKLATGIERFTDELAGNLAGTAAAARALLSGHADFSSLNKWLPALNLLAAAIIATLIAYLILRIAAGRGFARLDAWILSAEQPAAQAAAATAAASAATAAAAPATPGPAASPTQAARQAGQAPDAAGQPGRRSAGGAPSGRLRRFAALAPGRKLLGVLAALVIDLAATLLAALAAYVAVLALAGSAPGLSLFAVQFLTAFVLVESVKALSRGVFATRYPKLRLLPLSSPTAGYWNRWLAVLISLTGYGLLLVVPVADALFPSAVGRLLGLLIMLFVYVHAMRVIWKNRRAVRAGLMQQAEQSSAAVFGTLTRVLARTWHYIALAYFTTLFVVSQIHQQEALAFMTRATVQSLAAILLGLLASVILSSLLARRIRLPDEWRRTLPLLEDRINAYVPALLKTLRLLILLLATLVVLDAWHAFNLVAWVESESGHAAIAMLLHVGIILVLAALAWTILASIIEHRLGASGGRRPSEREKTLLMLFRNAAAVIIATMTLLIVLSQIGINIGPLIAGAGVAGLAIGFGAQKLVQDVITGVFIQLENGMNQNDVVELCGLFGTVEKITIRSVVIRTLDGGYHLIPFSTIDRLTNHTRDYGYHYGEYNIAHRESVDEAIKQLENAFRDLMQDPVLAPEILGDIDIPGVTGLTEKGFTIRVLIKTTPGNQWAVQRGFNRRVKQYFDAAGIEMPYPQTVVHFGRDKRGYASPADVRVVDSLREVAGIVPAPGQTPAA
ncbi:mechanosensitive ion channel domain-containing protein [Candidimonas nitroreducens]|uniref:Mechanosensitive ion channel protein n=1 Tax=Candidimonas nitroreducens TaxID=683354 RepID=A0A225MI36_9BURK|nr:mechanosensitive ion channel domain-containing protein [Candidimonas nitroreducens]OWT59161.1 mechanosensitive ion channel protein [Candidimonas nitroreducens]